MKEIEVSSKELGKLHRAITDAFNQKNERANIIIVNSVFEYLISRILKHHLPQLTGSSHAVRLKLLKDFRILDERKFQILRSFGIIRNYYAHEFDDCSLEDEELKEHVRNFLQVSEKVYNTSKAISKIEKKNEGILKISGIAPTPGWFRSKQTEMTVVATFLSAELLILCLIDPINIAEINVESIRIKTV